MGPVLGRLGSLAAWLTWRRRLVGHFPPVFLAPDATGLPVASVPLLDLTRPCWALYLKCHLRLGLKSSLDSGSNNSSGLSLKKPETYGLLRRQSRKQSRLGLVLSHPTGLSHNFCRDKDTKVTQPVDATMVRLISCLILPSSKLQSPQQRGCVGLETQAQQMTFQTPHNHASNSTPNPFVHTSPPTLPSHPQETYVRNLDMYVLKQTRAMPKLLHPPGDS
jgi:hypothetical protein